MTKQITEADVKIARDLIAKTETSLGHKLTSHIADLFCDNLDWDVDYAMAMKEHLGYNVPYIVVFRPKGALVVETQYIGPFKTHDDAYEHLCTLPAVIDCDCKFVQQLTRPEK